MSVVQSNEVLEEQLGERRSVFLCRENSQRRNASRQTGASYSARIAIFRCRRNQSRLREEELAVLLGILIAERSEPPRRQSDRKSVV